MRSVNVGAKLFEEAQDVARMEDCSVALVVRKLLQTYLPVVKERGLFNNLLEVK